MSGSSVEGHDGAGCVGCLTAVWRGVGFVAVVASGFPVGVDPGGRVERRQTVGFDPDVPPVVVNDPVVVPGSPTVGPARPAPRERRRGAGRGCAGRGPRRLLVWVWPVGPGRCAGTRWLPCPGSRPGETTRRAGSAARTPAWPLAAAPPSRAGRRYPGPGGGVGVAQRSADAAR